MRGHRTSLVIAALGAVTAAACLTHKSDGVEPADDTAQVATCEASPACATAAESPIVASRICFPATVPAQQTFVFRIDGVCPEGQGFAGCVYNQVLEETRASDVTLSLPTETVLDQHTIFEVQARCSPCAADALCGSAICEIEAPSAGPFGVRVNGSSAGIMLRVDTSIVEPSTPECLDWPLETSSCGVAPLPFEHHCGPTSLPELARAHYAFTVPCADCMLGQAPCEVSISDGSILLGVRGATCPYCASCEQCAPDCYGRVVSCLTPPLAPGVYTVVANGETLDTLTVAADAHRVSSCP